METRNPHNQKYTLLTRVFYNFTAFESKNECLFSEGVVGADYEVEIIFSLRRHFDATPRAFFFFDISKTTFRRKTKINITRRRTTGGNLATRR